MHRGDILSLKRRSKKCWASYILLAVLILLAAVTAVMVQELSEHFAEIAEFRSREAAADVMTEAVEETLSSCGEDTLYRINTDSSGRVMSAQLDTVAANRLKNTLTRQIELGLEEMGDEGVLIPLGTLLGIPVFSGRGTSLRLGVQQLGAVDSEFSSSIESAGINQTRLTVYVKVTAEIRIILPDGHKDISISEDYIINDSIIVGDIPQAIYGNGIGMAYR